MPPMIGLTSGHFCGIQRILPGYHMTELSALTTVTETPRKALELRSLQSRRYRLDVCPYCRQAMPRVKNLTVDLNTNIIAFSGHRTKLLPRYAALVAVLAEYYPQQLTNEELGKRIYGHQTHFHSDMHNTVRKLIIDARPKLMLLGLGIENVFRGGYRLVILQSHDEE